MDRTTLTAALKPLQRRGLVDIAVDPADRRGRLLTLTEDGMTLLASAVPIWQRTHEIVEAAMPDGAPATLRDTLPKLG
jgi:DNA-binding MarR family transcriptional regulator